VTTLDQSQLRHFLDFDPKTQIFTWKNPPGRRVRPGDPAGYEVSPGVFWIKICGQAYPARRLAHLYQFGHWDASRQPRGPNLTLSIPPHDPSDPHAVKHAEELTEAQRQRLLARTAARTAYRNELTRIEGEYLDTVKYLKQANKIISQGREKSNLDKLNTR
jgi:hypothetical protein